jgi:hypothetical protein
MTTPGPWTMKQGRNKSLWVMAPDETCVAEIGGHFEGHHEANARLIAAAPDLLAVLVRYVAADSGDETEDQLHKDAVAAIAKARGQ